MNNLTFDGDGANRAFVQRKLIDWGAFAEVHQVRLWLKSANLQYEDTRTKEVSFPPCRTRE